MSAHFLDTDLSSFLLAQHRLRGPARKVDFQVRVLGGILLDLSELQSQLQRVSQLNLDDVSREYLSVLKIFDDRFFSMASEPLPVPEVEIDDGAVVIRVVCSAVHSAMWWPRLSAILHGLHFDRQLERHGLDRESLYVEGIRRFQTKLDMVRGSGLKFVEAGTSVRPDFDWQSAIVVALMGDVPKQLIGTTNPYFGLTFGLPVVSTMVGMVVGPPDVRDRRRVAAERALESDGRILVNGANAYQMAHLHAHLGDRVLFEWSGDLVADLGPVDCSMSLETLESDLSSS